MNTIGMVRSRHPSATRNRIALAPAFAHHPPMLARVLSAALSRHSLAWETTAEVNGIETFPVEVEVNCGWGDTLI